MTQAKQDMTVVELDGKDLPAYCPNPNMPIWSSHPRVFIALENEAGTRCPYCGTIYKLKAGATVKGH
jgi:uncharacterized Zn-finger protein